MELTLNKASAVLAIVTFIGFVGYKLWQGEELILSDIVLAAIAAWMLPLAAVMTVYVFCPALIGSMKKMGLQITLTGLILLFVYIKTILEKLLDSS